MPNKTTHIITGAITGLIVSSCDSKTSPFSHNPASAVTLGTVFGTLPDILEPSLNNPHHRQFYHSLFFFGSLAIGLRKLYLWEPKNDFERIVRGISLIAGTSYASHLLLDSLTPRSLPLIGKM